VVRRWGNVFGIFRPLRGLELLCWLGSLGLCLGLPVSRPLRGLAPRDNSSGAALRACGSVTIVEALGYKELWSIFRHRALFSQAGRRSHQTGEGENEKNYVHSCR